MGGEKPFSYEPPPEKRFAVSPDAYSRERVRVLTETRKELEQEFGIPIAFSLFGSLSKGKQLTEESAPESDVDLTLFLDIDALEQNAARLFSAGGPLESAYVTILREEKMFAAMQMSPREHWERTGLPLSAYTPLLQQDVPTRARWLSAKRVACAKVEERLMEAETGYDDIASDVYALPIAMTGPHSVAGVLEKMFLLPPRGGVVSREMRAFQNHIARFFHLEVGGGLKKYRQAFLRELALADPAHAEQQWQIVRKAMEETERPKTQLGDALQTQYPETLHDALAYYGVDLANRESDKAA